MQRLISVVVVLQRLCELINVWQCHRMESGRRRWSRWREANSEPGKLVYLLHQSPAYPSKTESKMGKISCVKLTWALFSVQLPQESPSAGSRESPSPPWELCWTHQLSWRMENTTDVGIRRVEEDGWGDGNEGGDESEDRGWQSKRQYWRRWELGDGNEGRSGRDGGARRQEQGREGVTAEALLEAMTTGWSRRPVKGDEATLEPPRKDVPPWAVRQLEYVHKGV